MDFKHNLSHNRRNAGYSCSQSGMVLEEIRCLARFVNEYEDDFAQAIVGRSMKTAERDCTRKQKELDGLLARDKELDVFFERI